MIEEQGQVMAVDGKQVRVVVNRQSACGSCKARAACGQGVREMLRPGAGHELLAWCELPVRVGDRVVIGVPGALALRGALLVYLLPLLALLGGAVLAGQLGLGEGGAIAVALGGFAVAIAWLSLYNRGLAGKLEWLPQVLRVEVPVAPQPEVIRWQP